MTYSCKYCDKSIVHKSKYNHLKTITQKPLNESIVRRYIISNPNNDKIAEIRKRYNNIYLKKY